MYDRIGLGIVRFLVFAGIVIWMFTDNQDYLLLGIFGLGVLNDMQLQNMRS